jgi:hypothetical protein
LISKLTSAGGIFICVSLAATNWTAQITRFTNRFGSIWRVMETLRAPPPGLGALQVVIKSLEPEHSALEARRRQLETEIAALESALSKSIGQPLRVGNQRRGTSAS